jgi:3-dehydro-L-gulonate 2-dehydrogenase
MPILRIPFDRVVEELAGVLRDLGFTPQRAHRSATLFAEASRDGVASHGLNRFPRFVRQIRAGHVDVHAEPVRIDGHGSRERWDGRLGPGNLNAEAATARAVALARLHGIGLVALRNTNHWMRGGTYGWQAAASGCAFIGWTNTMPNMPPWGGAAPRLGNNPLVIAIPNGEAPVVLDMAMSQYSYGRLEGAAQRGERLPVPGGFDRDGQLTCEAARVLETSRVLPIGYWKGSGLALALDLLAAGLSGGDATVDIGRRPDEYGLSQVFIAIDMAGEAGALAALVTRIRDDLAAGTDEGVPEAVGRAPGDGVRRARAESLALGVPVETAVWQAITAGTSSET